MSLRNRTMTQPTALSQFDCSSRPHPGSVQEAPYVPTLSARHSSNARSARARTKGGKEEKGEEKERKSESDEREGREPQPLPSRECSLQWTSSHAGQSHRDLGRHPAVPSLSSFFFSVPSVHSPSGAVDAMIMQASSQAKMTVPGRRAADPMCTNQNARRQRNRKMGTTHNGRGHKHGQRGRTTNTGGWVARGGIATPPVHHSSIAGLGGKGACCHSIDGGQLSV
jgi:hypothetical protein